jgi:Mg-chelatase subunit ChlD
VTTRPELAKTLLGLLPLVLVACADPSGDDDVGTISLKISQQGSDGQGAVGAAVNVTKDGAEPVDLGAANPILRVEQRVNGGPWTEVPDVEADFQGPHRLDVVVVADNSGSELEDLEPMRAAITDFSHHILSGAALDRVGLVRVSTVARVLQNLTDTPEPLDAALDGLFVTNGWTALWDGVRRANEVLEAAPPTVDATGGTGRFCADRTHRAIVAFTDGRDNNSADEHDTRYAGDGIDTTLDDLVHLQIGGVSTPVHWVGVGPKTDADALQAMADATDAEYLSIEHLGQLHGALTSTAARLRSQVPICFELTACGHVDLRLTIEFDLDGEHRTLTAPEWAAADCDCQGNRASCTLVEP